MFPKLCKRKITLKRISEVFVLNKTGYRRVIRVFKDLRKKVQISSLKVAFIIASMLMILAFHLSSRGKLAKGQIY